MNKSINGIGNNKEVGNKIFSARKKANMSRAELGSKLGIHEVTVKKYEDGDIKALDINKLKEFANALDIPFTYLIGLETEEYTPTVKLPILGSVRAGVGGFAYEEQIGYEEAYMPNCDPETHFYLKVKGDSMEPRISEGDLALVKRQSDVESGDLAIVLVNGDEGVIKKVIKKENSIELHSFNMYYPPRIFEGKEMEKVTILGRVIRIMSTW